MEITARPVEADEREDVSVLVLGRGGSGRTSLVLSLQALRAGQYPKRFESKKPEKEDPYATLPADGGQKHLVPPKLEGVGLPLLMTDAEPCGSKDQVRLPGGRRLPVALRSHSLEFDAVLFVIDATAMPLFEDKGYCEEVGQLCATLRQQGHWVVLAVTKLPKAREEAVRAASHGADHGGRPGRDPRSSYEEFVSRYLEKMSVALQAVPGLRAWQEGQDAGSPLFPHPRHTLFDVPTWVSIKDFEAWKERRGTPELPNLRYMESQLEKVFTSLAVKPKRPSFTPWHQLTEEPADAGAEEALA